MAKCMTVMFRLSPCTPIGLVGPHAVRLRWFLAALIYILLTSIACANLTPSPPVNQRFWKDESRFVVLHWDSSPNAGRYVVYYSNNTGEREHSSLGYTKSTTAAVYVDLQGD